MEMDRILGIRRMLCGEFSEIEDTETRYLFEMERDACVVVVITFGGCFPLSDEVMESGR